MVWGYFKSLVTMISDCTQLAIEITTPEKNDLSDVKITWKEEEIEIWKWLIFQRIYLTQAGEATSEELH